MSVNFDVKALNASDVSRPANYGRTVILENSFQWTDHIDAAREFSHP